MLYGTLICFRYLADFYEFTFFCPCLERHKKLCFFCCTHVSMISSIMVSGDCFQSMFSIFCHKLRYISSMKARRFCCLFRTCPFGAQLQCFQSGFGSFILICLAPLFYRFYFFLTEFIPGRHFYHPVLLYLISFLG